MNPPQIPLIKTVHTAETLARALARQQRWLDRHHIRSTPPGITITSERLRMAKAALVGPVAPTLSAEQLLTIVRQLQRHGTPEERIALIRRYEDRHRELVSEGIR